MPALKNSVKNCHYEALRMPTPLGHALGGLAAAFIVNSVARQPGLSPPLVLASVAVAVCPDLDLLWGSHRTYTHSLGAVALTGLTAWLLLRPRLTNARSAALALCGAHASHLLLDWLGRDTSQPPGLTVWWPFSSAFFVSGYDLFGEVSRRYWRFDEFIIGNCAAVGWELLVLMPILLVSWVFWSGRTLTVYTPRRS